MLTSGRLASRRTVATGACLLACGLVFFLVSPAMANAEESTSETSADITLKGSDGSLVSVHAADGTASFSVSPRPPRLGNQERSEYVAPASTSGESFRPASGASAKSPFALSRRERSKRKSSSCLLTAAAQRKSSGAKEPSSERSGSQVRTATPASIRKKRLVSWVLLPSSGVSSPARRRDPVAGGGSQRCLTRARWAASWGSRPFCSAVARLNSPLRKLPRSGTYRSLRIVAKRSRPSRFRFDRALRTATVVPPAPFSGTATFRRGAKGSVPTWSGSLAVSFPGQPGVPLVGSAFTRFDAGRAVMLGGLRSPRREVSWIALWLVPKQAAVPDVELTQTRPLHGPEKSRRPAEPST